MNKKKYANSLYLEHMEDNFWKEAANSEVAGPTQKLEVGDLKHFS
jgi:hypothetical protein